MTKPGRAEREKMARAANRELQWHGNRMPRRDAQYRAAIESAVLEYEAFMQEQRDVKVRRKLKGLSVQQKKRRAA